MKTMRKQGPKGDVEGREEGHGGAQAMARDH